MYYGQPELRTLQSEVRAGTIAKRSHDELHPKRLTLTLTAEMRQSSSGNEVSTRLKSSNCSLASVLAGPWALHCEKKGISPGYAMECSSATEILAAVRDAAGED